VIDICFWKSKMYNVILCMIDCLYLLHILYAYSCVRVIDCVLILWIEVKYCFWKSKMHNVILCMIDCLYLLHILCAYSCVRVIDCVLILWIEVKYWLIYAFESRKCIMSYYVWLTVCIRFIFCMHIHVYVLLIVC